MKKQTKGNIKREAQREIMYMAQLVFGNSVEDYTDEMKAEMDKQFRRMEKLFNYEPGSWARSV